MPDKDLQRAVNALRSCRRYLAAARTNAENAAARLSGTTRGDRVQQLIEYVNDASAFAERCSFLVEGDYRAEGGSRAE